MSQNKKTLAATFTCLVYRLILQSERQLAVRTLFVQTKVTRAEFAALFAQFGTVSHCVILATRDSASRRRGFVVMSTHEQAKLAMSSLLRKPVR
jgi:RNA recognition motif-containing protein